MKSIGLLLILSFVLISQCKEDFPEEKDVLILTDSTFDKAIEQFEHIMVLFYAPWCGHCKKFHPEYEKAATTLKKEGLMLAKVDATAETKLAGKYEIHGYPTVKLFIKGEPIPYEGGRTEKAVVDWMRKKKEPATKEYKTEEEINKMIDSEKAFFMFFGDNRSYLELYSKKALRLDDFKFGTCDSEEMAKKFKAKFNSVVLFKKFDEKRNDLTEIKDKEFDDFVEKYSVPRILEFDQKTAQQVFGKHKPALVLYIKNEDQKYKEIKQIMEQVYDKKINDIKLVMTDIKDGMGKNIANYVGIKESDLPVVTIIDTRSRLKKYRMEGELNLSNILKFLEDWQKGKLSPSLKSQNPPEKNDDPVRVIVGTTFEKEVIKNDNDVMVLFYAPWCGHCKAFHPKYEEAAKLLKEKNPKLVLSKIDATENEVESVEIRGYPTIKFYPGKKKFKAPVDFSGDRTVQGVIKFLKENASNGIVYDESKKEDDKKDGKKSTDL